MQKFNLNELIQFDEKSFVPKVLTNQPQFRMVLLNVRAGQKVPEHATKETVTVYAVSGHIKFYENGTPAELRTGEVLWIEAGASHSVEAIEDSSLLVVATGKGNASEAELDLRSIPHFQRHPLVFAKFDALAVGEAFILVNDHDPFPLHRQMDTLRPYQVNWEYITQGPDIFRIRIRRAAPLQGSEEPLVAHPPTVSGIQPAR